ncbi:alpha/beta hydrolase family esterase [Trujillonella endophytica]|uniref:Polyhydroxybutyrate depolymerase n=1 Tax=Trujillonella endophytica TaxID=673521 RepID=A0A1H8WQT6_9ACTN|nr:PHB depolymerase family esterase [Trujillella endophytica]SEP30050.1 polyhydroxybutyrate depolymerase [Trujillella endophytica]
MGARNRRWRSWALALAALLVVVAVAAVARDRSRSSSAAGTEERVVDVGGTEREFRLYRPADLPESPALVLVLHGGGGSARQAQETYGWDDLAAREGFAVAYPQGLHRTWNAGDCCGRAARQGVDDVAFLTALVRTVTDDLDVDPRRVYLAGMSNGAMMGYAFACATDTLAALGAVAGSQVTDCPAPAPLSVVHVHGTADASVLIDGGTGSGAGTVTAPPLAEVMASWRSVDACESPRTTRSGDVTTESADCPEERTVESVVIDGAGHQWPGSAAPRAAADPPSTALDATDYLWDFFAAHPRP